MVDYKGQLLGERIYQVVTLLFTVVGMCLLLFPNDLYLRRLLGFGLGFYKQDFGVVVRFIGAGMIFSALLVLPDWAYMNRNPGEAAFEYLLAPKL